MRQSVEFPDVGDTYTILVDDAMRKLDSERAECMSKLQDARDSVFTLQQVSLSLTAQRS